MSQIATFDVGREDVANYPGVSKKLRDIGKARDHPKRDNDPDRNHDHSHSGCFGLMSQIGTGYPELDKLMKEPRDLRFTLHLHMVLYPDDYEKDSWQLNDTERLQSVAELRERGNELFRNNRFAEAVQVYKEALNRQDQLVLREKPGEPEWVELDNGKIPLLLNLAQCQLKLDQFYEAVQCCSEALKRDPSNEKGLFRRAKGHMGAWNLEEARQDLELLLRSHPGSETLVKRTLKELDSLEVAKTEKEKQFCHGIFDK